MADAAAPAEPVIEPPLAKYHGQIPPTPEWFTTALGHEPERSKVDVLGANIELLTWGERGKPGLVLVHGNSANADWWSFIAPYLALDFRVVAFSLSGMGESDWRETYSFDHFAAEAHGAAEAAGLYDDGQTPVFIGHSFGGSVVFYATLRHPEWMRATVLVDTGFGGPPPAEEGFRQPWMRTHPHRVYPTLEEALARFRFMPPQGCKNDFIADFIARRSLKRAPLDGGGEGWTWKFDPFLWGKLDRSAMQVMMDAVGRTTPMVHIYGEHSLIIRRQAEGGRGRVPDDVHRIVIPDSEHHIMVDQPLALVTALRGVLSYWPNGGIAR
jgi:pimeloyl-ACP methyl ester carboxylesterase